MSNKPDPFLEVIVHEEIPIPGLTGLCAGYEKEEWRNDQFADHLFEWLPEFALNYTESENLSKTNAVAHLRKAARNVYQSDKYKSRGEFGELLLHAVLRQIYDTIPAISKIFYKDSPNDTVKGFDAVHVVATRTVLELWLGEVKFYNNIYSAIADVIDELQKHTDKDYLRTEFAAITNKIDPRWPHQDKLKKLLSPNTSLDQVFDATCIPVLLTYDSPVVLKHKKFTDAYKNEIIKEMKHFHQKFCTDYGACNLRIHLFLIPLKEKAKLVKALNDRLNSWQNI